MFGQRRRAPLLGAAVIAGTATVAARHGAKEQAQMEAQRQFEIEQEAEMRRRAEEREQIRTQRAIDQAVNDAMAKQQADQAQAWSGGAAPVVVQPQPGPPPVYRAADDFVMPAAPSALPYLQPPSAASAGPPRPRSTTAADSGILYCSACGSKCGSQDNFCGRCGRSLLSGTSGQQAM